MALDVAFIGSVDLGTLGELDSAQMRTAAEAIEARAAARGVPKGILAGSAEAATDAVARAYRYIGSSRFVGKRARAVGREGARGPVG